MIKSIIVEDEWYTLEDIKSMVEETGFIEVTGAYENPLDALEEVDKTLPQVAFIDIDMPHMNGMTLAKKLIEKHPSIKIVFITAYNQYAVEAFEIEAMDYILKPVNEKRFAKMIERIKKSIVEEKEYETEISIRCFGDFEVKIDGVPVKWGRAKSEELFAFLLMNSNKKVHKEVIIDNILSEHEPSKALVILQTSISKLRKIFAKYEKRISIEYEGGGYWLTVTDCKCDLFFVENLLESSSKYDKDVYKQIEKVYFLIQKGLYINKGYIWAYSKEIDLMNRCSDILKKYYRSESKE